MTQARARVTGLYTTASAGSEMQMHEHVEVLTRVGIRGDRYAMGQGHYSRTEPAKPRHLTLITQDGIDVANDWQEASGMPAFTAAQTRRNVVLEGVSASTLNALVGQRFTVGCIVLRGIELCTPCPRPDELSSQQGFVDAFEGRGGLRAEVLEGGWLRLGDAMELQAAEQVQAALCSFVGTK